jgi:hypothetical protein
MKTCAQVLMLAILLLTTSCASLGKRPAKDSPSTSNNHTESAVEKIKPAAGTGNVQGKVLFNSKPAENIEVTLCEKFNQFFGGCGGKKYLARTDKDGDYVITNVAPMTYESLTARVFESNFYVFATTGITGLASAKYDVVADKTLFVPSTNLFKSDLKTVTPKAGERVSVDKLELRWAAYPEAAYYKFSIYPDDMSVVSPYVNERVESTSFVLDKPLQKGTYRWQVTAYNGNDVKLAESSRDIKLTLTTDAHN